MKTIVTAAAMSLTVKTTWLAAFGRGERPNVPNAYFSPGRAAPHWNGRLRVEC